MEGLSVNERRCPLSWNQSVAGARGGIRIFRRKGDQLRERRGDFRDNAILRRGANPG